MSISLDVSEIISFPHFEVLRGFWKSVYLVKNKALQKDFEN